MAQVELDNEFLDLFYNITNSQRPQNPQLVDLKKQLIQIVDTLKEIEVVLSAKCGANGKLFGSITSKDVSEALKMQHHIKLDKKKFVMDDIKTLGTTEVEIKVYTGISGKLKVVVKEH